MFRPRFTIALAIVVSSSLAWRLPAQQDASLESRADSLASAAGNTVVEKLVVPGAADLLVGYRLLGTSGSQIACGNAQQSVAFVVSAAMDGSPSWSEAAWLSIFESLLKLPYGDRQAGICMFAVKTSPDMVAPFPGDPLIRGMTLREALADMGMPAVVLLDFDSPPTGLAILAAAHHSMSPRRVLEAARAAAAASGIDAQENPVADFYAAAGVADGNALLGPWLGSGVPAIVLANGSQVASDSGTVEMGRFALAFSDIARSTPT